MATTTTTDGVRIHHETIGSGPDVVLVHGLTDSSETWGPIPGMLAERYRVTTLDLRGMGRSSDAGDYEAEGMTRDLAAVVAAVGIEGPLVVGHSLGGIVVTAYSGAAPVRGVVNVDQTLQLGGFQAGLQQVAPLLRDPASFPSIVAAIFEAMDGDQLSTEQIAAIAANRRQRQEVVLGVWNRVIDAPLAELDAVAAALAAGVRAPYLSLQFADFGPGYTDWLRGLVPHAVVETWTVAGGVLGHYGHLVQPHRFVERVIAFDH